MAINTTLFTHFAMLQPLLLVQCLSSVFSIFKNWNKWCMLSKLVTGLLKDKWWKTMTNWKYFFLLYFTMVDYLELNAITPNNAINLFTAHMFIVLVNIKLPNHHLRLKNLAHHLPTMFPQPFPGDTSKKK